MGRFALINVRDKTTTVVFPSAAAKERLDAKTYPSCPGPIDPAENEKFRAHGLYLRQGQEFRSHALRRAPWQPRVGRSVRGGWTQQSARADLDRMRGRAGKSLAELGGGSARRRLRGDEFSNDRHRARKASGGRNYRRGMGVAHGTRVENRARQRDVRSKRPRDLERRQVVLHRRVGHAVTDSPVARPNTGEEGLRAGRVSSRQRAVGSGRHAVSGGPRQQRACRECRTSPRST